MIGGLPPARKQLGQNFLVDPNIVRKIVEAAALRPDDVVVEIGPGRGALTRALCETAARVVAIEIDRGLCGYLREALADCPNFELHQADALDWPFDRLPPNSVVVANLPYYVSTPLLCRLLDERARLDRAIIMLQVEVAERLVASSGCKDYGVLSVRTQLASEVRLLFRVSPNCFRPRPDVGSAVVRLAMKPATLTGAEERLLLRLVRGAFAHRRKRLLNSLRDEGWDARPVADVLAELGHPDDCRAEFLSPMVFHELAVRLAAAQQASS